MSFMAGWKDRLNAKPFPPANTFDRWAFRRQSSYEEGRRCAAAAQGMVGHLPGYHKVRRAYEWFALPVVVMSLMRDEQRLGRRRPSKTDNRRVTTRGNRK